MILLDTHALIWMSADPKRLSKKARDAIREARQSSGLAVATITLWELALLAQRGRIHVAGTVESFVRETVSRVILRPMPLRLPPWLYGSPQTIRMTPQTVRLVPPRLSKDSRWLPPMSVSGQHKSLTLSDRPQSATDRREPRPA